MFSHRSYPIRCSPTSPQRRPLWPGWLFAAVVIVAVDWHSAAPLLGAEPGGQALSRDVYHTMLARTALLQDKALAPLNLGVRVQDRVATLWGPVPSRDLMRRAVEVLRKLPDLLEVRNELQVEEPEDLRPQFLPDEVPGPLPALPPSPPPLPGLSREDGARAVLTKRPASSGALLTPAENVRFLSTPPGFPTPNDEDPSEPVLPLITIPQAAPAGPTWSSLQLAVSSLRLSDPRFRELRAETQGGRVLLTGSAARWDDVRDFASGLNHLPGVERVILGQVHADR